VSPLHRCCIRYHLSDKMAYKLVTILPMLYYLLGCADASLICYTCDSHPGGYHYDANCGDHNYDGLANHDTYEVGCAMQIYDSGHVWRGFESQNQIDTQEACQRLDQGWSDGWATRCWCPDEKCNSYLCEECFPTTTAATTTTTTTQEPPSKGLSCYNCIDCPTVNENTQVVFNEDYMTCVTILKGPDTVMRSGGLEPYADGLCYVDGTLIFCHCTTHLCNGADVKDYL
ncbi:unnamed protein product, partial [Meganyctiphanes norvegica]